MTLKPQEILAGLKHLRQTDRLFQLFASESHLYELRPPLGHADIEEAEEQIGVSFPSEYRSFLAGCGAGGAGPHYGVAALEKVDGRWTWQSLDADDVGDLSRPFPHNRAWNLDGHALWNDRPDEDDGEALERWCDRLSDLYWDPRLVTGAVALCDRGCFLKDWLVMRGPARGQVWADTRNDHGGLSPIADADGSRHTFGAWYRRWLDEALAEVAQLDPPDVDSPQTVWHLVNLPRALLPSALQALAGRHLPGMSADRIEADIAALWSRLGESPREEDYRALLKEWLRAPT